MNTKRRIEITVETERVWLARPKLCAPINLCAVCAPQRSVMVTASTAAAVSDVDSGTIYSWVAERAVHFLETPEGLLLICLNSLPKLKG